MAKKYLCIRQRVDMDSLNYMTLGNDEYLGSKMTMSPRRDDTGEVVRRSIVGSADLFADRLHKRMRESSPPKPLASRRTFRTNNKSYHSFFTATSKKSLDVEE